MATPINTAKTFWIEAGKMSGGSRNQIEFTDALVLFFDAKVRSLERFDVLLPNGKTVAGKTARNRAQRYGQFVNIWRLGLPTVKQGGPKYPDTMIRIDKVRKKSGYVYELTVTAPSSVVAKGWRQQSAVLKNTGKTGGKNGRFYGYW